MTLCGRTVPCNKRLKESYRYRPQDGRCEVSGRRCHIFVAVFPRLRRSNLVKLVENATGNVMWLYSVKRRLTK